MIAAGAEAVLAAEHEKARALIVDRIVQRLELHRVKRIGGGIWKNDQIIRQQRERIARELIRHAHLHDAFALLHRFHESLPLARVGACIRDDEHLALALQIQVAHRDIVLRP